MKRGRSLMVALAVMMLAPLPLLAQGGGMGGAQGRGGMGMGAARALVEQGSVGFLMSKAADLKLTAGQKRQLQALATAWAETVRESQAQVKSALPQPGQGMGGGDREAMMARFQTLQPHIRKLVEEDAKAMEEALKLLDDEQKAAAKSLLQQRSPDSRPRRNGGGGA